MSQLQGDADEIAARPNQRKAEAQVGRGHCGRHCGGACSCRLEPGLCALAGPACGRLPRVPSMAVACLCACVRHCAYRLACVLP